MKQTKKIPGLLGGSRGKDAHLLRLRTSIEQTLPDGKQNVGQPLTSGNPLPHTEMVAAKAAARIGIRKTRRTSAIRALFSCPFNGGLCAGATCPPEPCPGMPTAYSPPPFIGMKDGGFQNRQGDLP